MVKGIYLAYKYTVATSEIISLPRLFVIFLYGLPTFRLWLSYVACYLPEGFRQITHSLFLCAMCYCKTDHNHEGEKICTSKKWFLPDLLLSSPALQIEILRTYNRVKRKSWYSKNVSICVKYFQSYKSIDSMKERRHTGTSTDEPLQMNLYRWTDKLFLLPTSPHQGRGGTAESFNR